jgi:hypothetical protein
MTRRASLSASARVSADVPNGVPRTPAETPADGQLTPQVSGEMDLPRSGPNSQSDQAVDAHTTRRSRRSSAPTTARQDLSAWAVRLAAELPPLSNSQTISVARIAARLDASNNADASGQEY